MRKKRDNKKLGLIWAAVIALLMVTSIFGYIGRDSQETSTKNYNGFEFFEDQNNWIVKVGEQGYVLDYFPEELEDIELEAFDINSEKVYVVYNGGGIGQGAQYSISKLISFLNSFGIKSVLACLDENNCLDDTLPLVSCDGDFPVIEFNVDSKTIIFINEECIVLQSTDENFSKLVDKLIYYWLGVME